MSEQDQEFARLMEQVRAGSEAAARELLRKYGGQIQRVVRRRLHRRLRSRFDSEDFVQAVWASVFRCRDQLTEFHGAEELAAHLATLAGNKVVDQHRRFLHTAASDINREEPLQADEGPDRAEQRLVSRDPTPSQVAIAHEQRDIVVKGQPDHYRRMVELRAAGESLAAIAARLGLHEGHVRRVLRRLQRRVDSSRPAAESP